MSSPESKPPNPPAGLPIPDGDQSSSSLDLGHLDAVLFDLDGVITHTAMVHAVAWKTVFDAYLRKRCERTGEPFNPFDMHADYRQYTDGKPRHEGVISFLLARGIRLPMGHPDDPPELETIFALGNAKQAYFLRHIKQEGVEVYESSLDFIRRLKARGIKVAVITSSKNCTAVLEAARIRHLFDGVVDGIKGERLGLKGKPDPATFLAAARCLGVSAARAAVVEDAIAGVQAGKAGHFAYVIGIDRAGLAEQLKASGADLVVHDLSELAFAARIAHPRPPEANENPILLPSALDHLGAIVGSAGNRQMVIFVDYDGTLTPIVSRPEDANLSDTMRTALSSLAEILPLAIVSGRDLRDVRQRVNLKPLYYAGSHGFEIAAPGDVVAVHDAAIPFLGALDQAEARLRDHMRAIPGVQIERKRFAIAVHFRRVKEANVTNVAAIVNTLAHTYPTLRQTGGKKIFELRPNLDWHKGTALFWLIEIMGFSRQAILPIYIGDDETDEDAFAVLQDAGIGILVSDVTPEHTAARYVLPDTEAVCTFLESLVDICKEGRQG